VKNTIERASLLIIDVQNDFCPGGMLPVREGDVVVPVINVMMEHFGSVVATQDWHPPGHISFASTHAGKKPFETVRVKRIEQVLWPDHCIQGSPGAAFHPDLDESRLHLILRKGLRLGLDSYSAFFENDKKTPTGLASYLREINVNTVWVCGLAADVCVFYSAMDAVRLDFETVVIEDAVRGVDMPTGNVSRTRDKMKGTGIRFAWSEDITGGDKSI
jgi:nicotinamidase/pyrazinamidase